MYALQANTTGYYNTASGYQALQANTTGNGNTATGVQALYNATGSNNTALGYAAGSNLVAGSGNIYLGHSGVNGDNNVLRLGYASTTGAFVTGVRGVKTGNNDAVPVVIDSNGQLGTVSSSRRFKKEIEDMGDATANLMRLRPVTFRYKQPYADGSEPIQFGLVAEEVAEVYPELVARSADGQIETVKYQVLDSMLLNEVQRLNARDKEQQEEIRDLKARLSLIESLLERAALAAGNQ